MKITREQLRRWGACYDDERIATQVPADGLAPLEIAGMKSIPAEDRLWVLLREELITARELRLLACDWAEAACKAAGWTNVHSLNAIAVGRRYAHGDATDDELAAAWTEAARAARSSGRSLWAAEASASSVRSSGRASAWWSALWASAAARAAQLADVVKVLKRIDEAAQAGKGAE